MSLTMTLTATFFAALVAIENPHGSTKVGPAGERGPLQITPVLVEDVNRIYGTNYTIDDCWSYERSVVMAKLYLGHYCTARRLGYVPTVVDAARIWNGGPLGHKKNVTRSYAAHFTRKYRELTRVVTGSNQDDSAPRAPRFTLPAE